MEGHVPLECLSPTATPRIEYAGRARLTFPARPELGGRRVEFVDSEVKAIAICEQFNKSGKEPVFQIAADLLHNKDQEERRALLAADLEAVLGDRLRAVEEKAKIEAGPISYVTPEVDLSSPPLQSETEVQGLNLNPPGMFDGDSRDSGGEADAEGTDEAEADEEEAEVPVAKKGWRRASKK